MDTQRVAPAAPRVGDSVSGVLRDVDPLDLSLWRQVVEADRTRCQPVSRLWWPFILHLPLAIMGHLSPGRGRRGTDLSWATPFRSLQRTFRFGLFRPGRPATGSASAA